MARSTITMRTCPSKAASQAATSRPLARFPMVRQANQVSQVALPAAFQQTVRKEPIFRPTLRLRRSRPRLASQEVPPQTLLRRSRLPLASRETRQTRPRRNRLLLASLVASTPRHPALTRAAELTRTRLLTRTVPARSLQAAAVQRPEPHIPSFSLLVLHHKSKKISPPLDRRTSSTDFSFS